MFQLPIFSSSSKEGGSETSADWDVEYSHRQTILTALFCFVGGVWLSLGVVLLLLLCKEKRRRLRSEPPPRLTKLQTEWRQNGPRLSTLRLILAVIWLMVSGAMFGLAILRFAFPTYTFRLNSGDQRHFHMPWSLGGTMMCGGLRLHSQNVEVPTFVNLLPVGGISGDSPAVSRVTRTLLTKHGVTSKLDKSQNFTNVRSTKSAIQTFEFFLLPKWNKTTNQGASITGRVNVKSFLWTVEGHQQFIACTIALNMLNPDAISSAEVPQISACGSHEALEVNEFEDFKHQFQVNSLNGEYVYLVFLLKNVISQGQTALFNVEIKRHVLKVASSNRLVISGKAVHLMSAPVGLVVDFHPSSTDKASQNFTTPLTTSITMNCDVDGRLLGLVFSILPIVTALLYYFCMCSFHNTLSSCKIQWFEKRGAANFDEFSDINVNKRRSMDKNSSFLAGQTMLKQQTSSKRFAIRPYTRMTPLRPAPAPPMNRKEKRLKNIETRVNTHQQNGNLSTWSTQFQPSASRNATTMKDQHCRGTPV